ncbi:hypothetical protein Clacol_007503 [Clathrus columnatus]|uniref:Uncharacterized protein n=1 Tax=Clathrus columnatus TaxID=1419009 RepID=A0AAV5AHN1_9AGAM|nr:hypothetical protein Clacol_007503 [Clathrus columnatus]
MVSDIPPSYDDSVATPPTKTVPVKDSNVYQSEYHDDDAQVQAERVPLMQPGPSYVPGQVSMMHHYVNPLTGEHIVSPLPPNHPEMICLQEGTHVRRTKFGLLDLGY